MVFARMDERFYADISRPVFPAHEDDEVGLNSCI